MDDAAGGLIDRIRALLVGYDRVREKAMFGGRAVMLDDKLLVSVGGDDDLLVRTDPDRADELLAVPGARIAEMGQRSMGPSWLHVDADAIATDQDLEFWLEVAITYNKMVIPRGGRNPRRR